MVKRVLLVENEKQIARFIDLELQKEGYQVDVVEDGKAGLALIAATKYDLILFNYDLSDMSGETFAEEISRIRPASVLIVLDSREKIAEHKESIQRFAVSYMVKPFIISDLVDKITAIFRGRDYIDQHCSQMKIPTSYRNLRIDVEHHTVYRGKDMISLTRREYDLLATLMGSKGVVTRDQLLESVWKYESTGETNIVDEPRILYLQKILLERTDEENPLSTTQLINILNDEYGISAHRTTVTKDIAALQEFGMDIVTIHSTQSKYFVASRKFELPELKLLIDAVESSKFITKKKSETLIEKIHTMTSPGQASKLKRNNYVVNRIKPDNEQIYYIIDAINDAINAGKQISFQYYDYTGLKKKVLKNKGEVYKFSPYKLLWCGDYYYVLGYSEKKSKVINFRVDRIASKPEILDKDIIPMPDDFDIENYTKEVFFMFSGEKVLVDLRCDNSLMKTMVDRFGENVTTLAYDMTSFRVQTEVSASPTFFGWVFGFNGKVQILAPESVKEQYRQMIAKADENMQESE